MRCVVSFSGFPPELYEFLVDLSLNNRRDWFDANKDRYESHVRGPALAFVRAMGERLPELSASLIADDRKAGGSLMRIHRDTRFAKDKTPYKTNVGIHFRHAAGKDVHAPGVYVHLALDEHFLGSGIWQPAPDALTAIRSRIAEDGAAWFATQRNDVFAQHWSAAGSSLKTAPRGYDKAHPMIDELRRKDFIAMSPMTDEDVFAPDVVDRVMERLLATRDYLRFLTEACGQAF
jgi:uncharacterized protein (TIGR02453 family)